MKKLIAGVCLLSFLLLQAASSLALDQDSLQIKSDKKHMHSRLSKRFCGYEFTIKNRENTELNIENLTIKDTFDAKAAYKTVDRTAIGAVSETLAFGVGLAIPTLTLSLIGAIIATPFIIVGNSIGNIGAGQESRRFDKAKPPPSIKPGETVKLLVITEKSTKPELTFTAATPQGESFSYAYKP